MSCSKKPHSGTPGSSSSSPSGQTQTHQTPSSVAASKETPHQENPNQQSPDQETEAPARESKRIKLVEYSDTSSEEEDSDEEEIESPEKEYDPDEVIILFPDTSNADEQYDDITFLRYIQNYEKQEHTDPLPISILGPEPTRDDMDDLLSYITRRCSPMYGDLTRCLFRNKIIKMQNKYRNIVQEKGENPTAQDFNTPLGKLHFYLMKAVFVWED